MKGVDSVVYVHGPPPPELADVVHCFWELRTEVVLDDDLTLHAIPDACVNLLFDQHDVRVAGVTLLHTGPTTLPLGRWFHYAGIQLYPGVWRGDPEATVDHYVGDPYEGELPLVEVGAAAAARDGIAGKAEVFVPFVRSLLAAGVVEPNPVTAAILAGLGEIRDVGDMARVAGLSTRQLQRTVKRTTGFTPHDLWKVLRVQQAFRQDHQLLFADQAHFTHAFRGVTGHPPARFARTFDV